MSQPLRSSAILENILEKLPVHDAVHGFRRDRSIVTNAQPYVGADVVINFDLQDFFPSISYKRVKGIISIAKHSNAFAPPYIKSKPMVSPTHLGVMVMTSSL